jgi:tRNA pseudouridine55 synthase
MKPSPYHGLLVLDKPGGLTSRAAVDRALRWFPRGTRLGHTGTLDPLATGVLVLCVGTATRLAEYVQQMSKTYRTVLRLGARSDTDDADGTVTPVPGAFAPARATLEQVVGELVGDIDQVPPAYSAIKVTGQRAYDRARRGEEMALEPRRVRVHGIKVCGYEYPRLELEIHCGKGTYIRSLARDLGERLGCGALVEVLRRTRVGPFVPEQATPLDADAATARQRLLPLAAAVEGLTKITLGERAITLLRQGGALLLNDPSLGPNRFTHDGEVAVFDAEGRLALIVRVDLGTCVIKPSKVLPGPAAG